VNLSGFPPLPSLWCRTCDHHQRLSRSTHIGRNDAAHGWRHAVVLVRSHKGEIVVSIAAAIDHSIYTAREFSRIRHVVGTILSHAFGEVHHHALLQYIIDLAVVDRDAVAEIRKATETS